jgi:uncharacterized protein (UPF0548 family)
MTDSPRSALAYRWGRSFSGDEVARELACLPTRASTGPRSDDALASDSGWHHYYSEALIAQEAPGPPAGAFERARQAVIQYAFSDPDIVQAHFDTTRDLLGRPMLLELKILGLHMLCGVTVRDVRDQHSPDSTVWGFRYDTLEGHVEAGAEWFLLSKEHLTGKVRFRIQAAWQQGTLPNWWTRIGFALLARRYQRAWHHQAYARLRALVGGPGLPALPHRRSILQAWQPPVAECTGTGPPIREREM